MSRTNGWHSGVAMWQWMSTISGLVPPFFVGRLRVTGFAPGGAHEYNIVGL